MISLQIQLGWPCPAQVQGQINRPSTFSNISCFRVQTKKKNGLEPMQRLMGNENQGK